MFKFGFSDGEQSEERNSDTKKKVLEWIPASVVEVSPSCVEKSYERHEYTENVVHGNCKLKLIKAETALRDLTRDNCRIILEAESQHSDLIPAKYEGGLKVWECSYDLGRYIFENQLEFTSKVVLDLGCGAGIIGLIALLKGAVVHFQDYNVEVINSVTVPNIILNFEDRAKALENCQFYCGDWESFATLSGSTQAIEPQKYDYIFTSETIYNPENHRKLYEVFRRRLKQGGIGFIAAKSYYFGVGGGMRQFQSLVEEDGEFDVRVVWKSEQGLQREILKMTRKCS